MTGRGGRLLPWLWPVLLTVLITAPLLAPGYVVGYDLVFVPDLTLRLDQFGVTTAMPRAVPSDVLVAVLDEVTGGELLNKLVLVAIPLVAGFGMLALWRELRLGGPLAGTAAVTLYVWNPYVAERFRLGAWALLLGYAALPWLVRSAVRLRRGEGWAGFLLVSAVCALTASGGITALLVAGLVLLWPGRVGSAWPLGGAAVLNAPWIVAGLTHSGTTDQASVAAFAARSEGYGGVLPTLLTLGGVWNADVVPAGRGDVVPVVLGYCLLVASLVGVWIWWRRDRLAGALIVAGAVGLVIALLGVALPGALGWVVAHVPGAGLFRDGQRYLGPLALVEAIGFGKAAAVLIRRVPLPQVVGATAALLPVAALPGLATGGGLKVSHYPADWAQAQSVVRGTFIPWPFESYRAPSWNRRSPVLDPMPRYFNQPAVVPDELIVGGHRLSGEDPRAAAIATALRTAVADRVDPTPVLLREGIRQIVVDLDAGGPSPRQYLPNLTEELATPTLTVYRLPGTSSTPGAPWWRVTAVLAAWTAAGAVLLTAAAPTAARLARTRRQPPA